MIDRTEQFDAEFNALDNSLRLRIIKAIEKIQEKPELGKPLRKELAGYFSKHAGGMRIIYKYDENCVYLYFCRPRKFDYE